MKTNITIECESVPPTAEEGKEYALLIEGEAPDTTSVIVRAGSSSNQTVSPGRNLRLREVLVDRQENTPDDGEPEEETEVPPEATAGAGATREASE